MKGLTFTIILGIILAAGTAGAGPTSLVSIKSAKKHSNGVSGAPRHLPDRTIRGVPFFGHQSRRSAL